MFLEFHLKIFWWETRPPFRYWRPSQELCPRPPTHPRKIFPPTGRPGILLSPTFLHIFLHISFIFLHIFYIIIPSYFFIFPSYFVIFPPYFFIFLRLCPSPYIGFRTWKNFEFSSSIEALGLRKNPTFAPLNRLWDFRALTTLYKLWSLFLHISSHFFPPLPYNRLWDL